MNEDHFLDMSGYIYGIFSLLLVMATFYAFYIRISTRKMLEKANRNFEDHKKLFDLTNECILLFTADNLVIYANRSARKILGYSREDILDLELDQILQKNGKMNVGLPKQDHIKTKSGKKYPIEYKFCKLSHFADHQGVFGLFFTLVKDEVHKKATTGIFHDSLLPQIILTNDKITACNQSACQLLDVSMEEIKFKPLSHLLKIQQSEDWQDIKETLDREKSYTFEWHIVTSEEMIHHQKILAFSLDHRKGNSIYHLICVPEQVYFDQSEHLSLLTKYAEEQKSLSNREAFFENETILDEDLLEQLAKLHQENFETFLSLYFETIDFTLSEIHRSIYEGHTQNLYNSAHYLKSISSSIGLVELCAIADKLENSSQNLKDLTTAETLYQEATSAYQETKQKVMNLKH